MSDINTIWSLASESLKARMNADTFDRWMAGIVPVRIDDNDVAVLGVSNELFCDWLSNNYSDVIMEEIEKVTGKKMKLSFESGHVPPPVVPNASKKEKSSSAKSLTKGESSQVSQEKPWQSVSGFVLNQRFTFDTFVVGENSKFAYGACKAVAEAPGITYNPLFLHGSSGLGKSHLLHAIAQDALSRNPDAQIEYVTCEEFTNQYVEAMRNGRLPQFRERYRKLDFLFVDDVEFLAGRAGFQEEFFHTFNALHGNHKQIVLTADKAPMEIQNLEKRLVSRFEWGLTADIQQPDFETRLAILRKKQETQEVKLSEEVIEFLANNLKSNVRRLEGALLNLVLRSTMDHRAVDIQMAEMSLSEMLKEESTPELTVEMIQRKVADFYNIRFSDMTSKRRLASIVLPRQVAMFLARKLMKVSYPELGDQFSRNHATILHAVNSIEERMKANQDFSREMAMLEKKFRP